MDILTAILLGLVQGLTEFLPVSSSGHQVLAQNMLGADLEGGAPLVFTVLVHLASAFAIVVHVITDRAHWKRALRNNRDSTEGHTTRNRDGDGDAAAEPAPVPARGGRVAWRAIARWVAFIVLGSVPAAIVGIGFEDPIEEAFASVPLVGVALIGTAIILVIGERLAAKRERERQQASPVDTGHAADSAANFGEPTGALVHETSVLSRRGFGILFIGLAQAFAIIPGISRSGSTIATGLGIGLRRDEAVRFSFLLALPALFGAALLKARDLENLTADIGAGAIIAGFVSSFVSSYLALRLLVALARRGRLSFFAIYCLVVGVIAIINPTLA